MNWPSHKNPAYETKTNEQKMAHLVEECGEVMAAVGKSLRWGLNSVNPELPVSEQETNRDWILRELADLELAISNVKEMLSINSYAASKDLFTTLQDKLKPGTFSVGACDSTIFIYTLPGCVFKNFPRNWKGFPVVVKEFGPITAEKFF